MAGNIFESGNSRQNLHESCDTNACLEILLQQAAIFAEKNAKFIQASTETGLYKCEATTAMIFAFCEQLHQHLEVKYITCELFDRFMTKHVADLEQYVTETVKPTKRKSYFQEIMTKVQSQAILRMLSCIQIASKLSSNYSVLRICDVGNALRKAGNYYSPQIILNSELRVLKTLEFRVSVDTAFTYLEIALAILGSRDSRFADGALRETCVKILDVVCLKRRRIYSQLFFKITGKYQMTEQDLLQFSPVENDLVLLGSAVVDCAVFLEHQEQFKQITEQLSAMSMIPCDDIMDFASVIIEEIFQP